MATYSIGTVTGAPVSGLASWEIRTASTDRARLLEMSFNLTATAAAAFRFGLGRPGAIGVTPTSPITFLAENPADPVSTVTSAIAWGTGPTAPTEFFRRFRYFGVVFLQWAFDDGLVIPVSSSLVIWAISATQIALNAYAKVDE